jgi:hypothetical protein
MRHDPTRRVAADRHILSGGDAFFCHNVPAARSGVFPPCRSLFPAAPPMFPAQGRVSLHPAAIKRRGHWWRHSPIRTTIIMPGLPLPSSGVGRRDGGESGEQLASNGSARGRRRQQRSSPSTSAGSYRNQTTGEPFSWSVANDVMLPMVLRMHTRQERHMKLFEAVRANFGDAGLRA